jgi:hypothetical protein
VAVSGTAAFVLGLGLGVLLAEVALPVAITVWYEQVWLPLIAGDED